MKKRIIFALTALLLLLSLSVTALAHEVPDPERKGSIEITMLLGEKPVPGGELICTRVGDLDTDDGNWFFRRVDGEKLTDVLSEAAAEDMEEFVEDYGETLLSWKADIDSNGKAMFAAMDTGLYLITQEHPASGYNAIRPFLVGLPNPEDGHYVYDVAIYSKSEPEKGTQPTQPTKPSEPSLPQTGQLNWPIPVLTAAGLTLLILGCALSSRKRKKRHET